MTSLPSGKQPHNYGKSPFLMGKLTISMAIFNSYVKLPEGIHAYLVGGLEHFLLSIIFGIIIPIDFHIFQGG